MYNPKYKIHFKFNPIMQCILGQFFGWQLVLEAFNHSRKITKDDEVLFTLNKNNFNEAVKHIQKMQIERDKNIN